MARPAWPNSCSRRRGRRRQSAHRFSAISFQRPLSVRLGRLAPAAGRSRRGGRAATTRPSPASFAAPAARSADG
ncbi:MAG: hypothetical protein AMJ81_11345 [Phycisphaerae bacterium SM23_33]|nr:MAG: hypothetical protein AMJ81_11345 [Phycisphaerae bacterium SM23_33]